MNKSSHNGPSVYTVLGCAKPESEVSFIPMDRMLL